jgi:hypothetical protein
MLKLFGVGILAAAFAFAVNVGTVGAQPPKKGDKGGDFKKKFEEQQKKKTEEAFKAADTDGNGKLSKSEFTASVEKSLAKFKEKIGEEKAKEYTKKQNELFDKHNKDGQGLTLEQYTALRREAFSGFQKGGPGAKGGKKKKDA